MQKRTFSFMFAVYSLISFAANEYFFLRKENLRLTSTFEKLSYKEYPYLRVYFLWIKLLVLSRAQFMQFALDKRPNAEGRQMYSRSYALRPLYWTINHLGRPEHLVILRSIFVQ